MRQVSWPRMTSQTQRSYFQSTYGIDVQAFKRTLLQQARAVFYASSSDEADPWVKKPHPGMSAGLS